MVGAPPISSTFSRLCICGLKGSKTSKEMPLPLLRFVYTCGSPCRNQRLLFYGVITSPHSNHYINELLKGKVHTHFFDPSYIYEVHVSATLNGSSVMQLVSYPDLPPPSTLREEKGGVVNICTTFLYLLEFQQQLPHLYSTHLVHLPIYCKGLAFRGIHSNS